MKVLTMSCMVAFLAAVGCAPSTNSTKMGNSEKLALLGSTKIDAADAIKAALAKASGRVLDTELRTKNGKTVWEIDIAGPDNKITEVDVDAATGTVTDSE
ncbi:MAG TPA: PepSY domain-containing protein [Kofleriaceae bacterium]|jgi:uncharacterized membrane protein YkoI|nr:PepSY domain-containing protein [Kofleriaceae bacterium]